MTPAGWYSALCTRMGWSPTAWRLAVLAFWAKQEGMDLQRSWNPFATTYHAEDVAESAEDVGYGPGRWNSVGVGLYATPEAGVEATARTLELSHYPNIRAMFADQVGRPGIVGPKDFTTWVGSPVYGQRVLDFAVACNADRGYGSPATVLAARVARLEALFGPEDVIADWASREAQLLVGYAALQGQVQALANQLAEHVANAWSPTSPSAIYSDIAQVLSQASTAIDAAGKVARA